MPKAGTGRDRFTTERFLGGIGDAVAKDLIRLSLSSGYQLSTRALHSQTLPAVLILAAYSRYHVDVELVDDYDKLLEMYQEVIPECAHPDKYLASCICILHPREQFPSLAAFEDINVPQLFTELTHIED